MQKGDRTGRIAIGIVLAGLSILVGCGQQAGTGAPKGGPPEVAVVTVQPKRLVLTTELSGRTSDNQVAEVRPQVSGIIQKRLFTEGADVKAGQTLYQIDPAPFQAALDNAAANLAAVAEERRPGAGGAAGEPCQRDPAAGHRRRSPERTAERFEEAFKEGAVSASQRDQAATEAEVAEATLLAVRPRWKATGRQ